MRTTNFLPVASLLLVTLTSTPATAQQPPSTRVLDVAVEGVHQDVIWLRNGFSMILTANANDPGVETELDVFAYPGGAFLARHMMGDPIGAVIPASTSDRRLSVIIRGQPGSNAGNATFQVVVRDATRERGTSTGVVRVEPVHGFDQFTSSAPLRVGSHVMTVQQDDGPEDSLLIVHPAESQALPPPIQLDDDNGVGAMSWMHLVAPCAGTFGCTIVVARRTNTLNHTSIIKRTIQPGGKATVVIDDEIHLADTDRDGLSNQFEQVLGSNGSAPDTDGDGLRDSFEVIGKDSDQHPLTSLLKFPLYGANILEKDLFLEVHWQALCNPGSPMCDPMLRDQDQPRAAFADELARIFKAIGVNTHLDNRIKRVGTTNSGDWGGAGFLMPWGRALGDFCVGRSPERASHFYHLITAAPNGVTRLGTPCSLAPIDSASNATHEIGHGFGLNHGGPGRLGGHDNCRPNYISLMNYALQRTGFFSDGSRPPLNPISVEEAVGLGTPDPEILAMMLNNFGREIDSTGGIDWDHDGIIAAAGTPGAAWLNYAAANCDKGAPSRRETNRFLVGGPPVLIDQRGTPVVFSVGRPVFNRLPTLIQSGGDLSRCSQSTTNVDANCARFGSASGIVVGSNVALSETLSPAAVPGLVVAADTNGRLHAFTPTGRPGIWGMQRLGLPNITGDPIAIEHEEIVSIYAPSGTTLRRWDFDRRFGVWVTHGAHLTWEDANPVFTKVGIGATVGFQTDVTGPAIYAALKEGFTVENPAEPPARMTLVNVARIIRTVTRPPFFPGFPGPAQVNEHWRKVPSLTRTIGGDFTNDGQRVALSYLPFPGGPISLGRFYLTFRHLNRFGQTVPYLTVTRGNRPTIDERDLRRTLKFIPEVLINNPDTTPAVLSKIYLAPVAGQLRGVGLSGATLKAASFLPNVDGVYSADQRDFDDISWIHNRFNCTLRANCN